MWIPESAEEIERLAREGSFEETHHFDAKELPGRNPAIAVDVCAMTADGGTLLYGVAEDDGRPTRPAPFELEGQRERLDQVVATSILEPPTVLVTERRLPDDPGRGYLIVNVPQSARAPHQVVVGGDLRFYGRGATGNRILTEPEVAALYARREQWEVDRERLLDEVVATAPVDHTDGAFVHAFARPVASNPGMLRQALGGDEMVLRNALVAAANSLHVRVGGDRQGVPRLGELRGWELHGAEGIAIANLPGPDEFRYAIRMTIGHDGQTTFFGCAGFLWQGAKLLFGDSVAANVGNYLAATGALYEVGGYVGNVDIGVALTRTMASIRPGEDPRLAGRYPHDSYREVDRALATELRDHPGTIAERLLRRFLDATVAFDYSPWVARELG